MDRIPNITPGEILREERDVLAEELKSIGSVA